MKETAVVYCEGQFGKLDGKTANGLVRHSEKYEVLGIIDSTKAGLDAGEYLDGINNGIPVFRDLEEALKTMNDTPDFFIYGVAPLEPFLQKEERKIVLKAMEKGMDIVNGLFEFFTNDEEFVKKANECGVKIYDVRKTPAPEDLHGFTNQVKNLDVPRIAVLGTDCACGKRTTATIIGESLREHGLKVALIATGQTALIQGAKYGVAIDAMYAQYMIGEIENSVLMAYKGERPDIIIIEGQSSVSHPAYLSSWAIIRGGAPQYIILQHPPKRKFRCDFPNSPMPTVESEIELIETLSKSTVVAITLNHEDMTDEEIKKTITEYEKQLKLPTTDVLKFGSEKVVKRLFEIIPEISKDA